ncbi:MAG: hypothetical protein JNL10_02905 [Verrucomicrobiales bacterium]|nr:hypothetical protein [Verrucomicrobiales bacterium]
MTKPRPSRPIPAGDPANRARVIESSLKCYEQAWLGWIPILGMVYCVTSLVWAFRARRESGGAWNPATGYRTAGLWIAGTSFLVWLCLDGLLLFAILQSLR